MKNKIAIETPLWERQINGKTIYFKMDNFQPTGSFKCRGIGNLVQHYVEEEHLDQIFCASGGNAGFAAAYAGKQLGVKTTVIVPEKTLPLFINKIKGQDAEVIEYGPDFDVSSERAKEMAEKFHGGFVSPYDHPKIWEGNATVIEESVKQMNGKKPGAVIVAVGGGGLIIGIIEKLREYGWDDVPVFGVETTGCASMHATLTANEWVSLEKIDTVAKSLGAKRIARHLFDLSKNRKIESVVVSDYEAVHACKKFLDDERILVEPACGAALAALYEGKSYIKDLDNILVIVCGGVGINFDFLKTWLETIH